MIKNIRRNIVESLWQRYLQDTLQMQCIVSKLAQQGITEMPLDHFAVIDLPGPNTGIPYLQKLFSLLGYIYQGKGYLANKQNDFVWLTEEDCRNKKPGDALPQVVVADFRLDEMPAEIRKIIYHYSKQAAPICLDQVAKVLKEPHGQDELIHKVQKFFNGRDWPMPTVTEYLEVKAFNELLAWVLLYGRKPNHFTLAVHLMEKFDNLQTFNQFVENTCDLELNHEGGVVKGHSNAGIAQSSTNGEIREIELNDGHVQVAHGFVEFVWRYLKPGRDKATTWHDYFTGFVAQHADHVIESLTTH